MDNITEYMMQQLMSVGFSYPDYEHHLNHGMLYFYQGTYYCIGGWENEEFTETDRLVACSGLWLPDSHQLLEWLKENHFTVTIGSDVNERYYHVCAVDSVNGCQYTGGGFPLSYALHKAIYKVCKSNRRKYRPETKLRLEITKD